MEGTINTISLKGSLAMGLPVTMQKQQAFASYTRILYSLFHYTLYAILHPTPFLSLMKQGEPSVLCSEWNVCLCHPLASDFCMETWRKAKKGKPSAPQPLFYSVQVYFGDLSLCLSLPPSLSLSLGIMVHADESITIENVAIFARNNLQTCKLSACQSYIYMYLL